MTSSDTVRPPRRSASASPSAASSGSASASVAAAPLLLTGFCFGLGYGVVQRLMDLELPQLVQLGQPFEVRPFPGTTLESLRLRLGAPAGSIRADLGVLELEEQQRQEERRRRQAAATPPAAADLEPAPAPLPPAEPAPEPSLPADPLPAPEPLPADTGNAPTP
jgi:hypothetical protein